jgi:hypothetical protein
MSKTRALLISLITILIPLSGLAFLFYVCSITGLDILPWGGRFHNTAGVADFNGDGWLDVLVSHTHYETESAIFPETILWIDQGRGRFSPSRIAYFGPATPGDLDGDGFADIAFIDQAQSRIFLNQGENQGGDGVQFRSRQTIRPQQDHGTAGRIYLGDLDNDGDLDAFVAGCCSMAFQKGDEIKGYIPSHAWVWQNNLNSSPQPKFNTKSLKDLDDLRMRDAALGDLDGDGFLDLFAAILAPRLGEEGGHPDLVLLNDGTGNLRDSGQRLGEADSRAVALGDLDGDGDLDALVGSSDGTLIWINQGGAQGGQAGQFELAGSIDSGDTHHLFLADFDSDGGLDVLIAGERQAYIWLNDGQGNFTRARQPAIRYSAKHGLAVADFNGDGYPDIFAGAYRYDYFLLLNQGNGAFRRAMGW